MPDKAQPSEEISSPCRRNCCLDDNEVCLGCGRTLNEIVTWRDLTESQRLAIMKRCAQTHHCDERRKD